MASPPLDPPPKELHLLLDLAFQALVSSTPLPPTYSFVKHAAAPKIWIISIASWTKALGLSDQGLINQSSGIYPSVKSMAI